jgi:hypothetical protein
MGISGKHTYIGLTPAGNISSGDRMGFEHTFSGTTQPSERDFKTVQVTLEYQNCRNAVCSGAYVTSGRIAAIIQKA